ncbi:MAG: hypothetical protein HYY51_02365 [Candidatus Magasanikbacteria bacterium]|nr:hypothetical protein [Candidatus Magasanikbacteria bacterium]
MKKSIHIFFLTTVVIMALGLNFAPFSTASAETELKSQALKQLNAGAEKAGLKPQNEEAPDVRVVIANIIKVMLKAYGIIFIVLMVNAGYNLVTSHGEEDKIQKAYGTIQAAVIGLIIILSAYSIAYLVASKVKEATGFGDTTEAPLKQE